MTPFIKQTLLACTTPHMFHPGFEATSFARMCDAVKRPLYGADCYAYALVASGFGEIRRQRSRLLLINVVAEVAAPSSTRPAVSIVVMYCGTRTTPGCVVFSGIEIGVVGVHTRVFHGCLQGAFGLRRRQI